MKVIIKLFTILALMFTVISCSKKQGSSTASFDLNFASITASDYQGGMMILGHSLDDQYNFSMAINPGQGIPSLELHNGEWEFFIAYWDGAGILQGASRCGYSGVYSLTGSQTDISFTISQGACSSPISGGENPSVLKNTSGGFPGIQFQSCITVDSSLNGGASCLGQGLSASYRVSLQNETRGVEGIAATSLQSACYPVDGVSHLSLPSGDQNNGSIFNPRVEFFTTSDCSQAPVIYEFRDGLLSGIDSQGLYSTIDYSTSEYTSLGNATVYIEHNTSTPVGFMNPMLQAFGDGRDGDSVGSAPTAFTSYILSLSSDGHTLSSATTAGSLTPGDELIWHVVNQDCGSTHMMGKYGFVRVKSVNGSEIELFSSFNKGDASSAPSDFSTCRIQLQKVFNYENFTMSSNPMTPSSMTPDMGGIFAMRVKQDLIIDSEINTTGISATGKGYLNPLPAGAYDHCGPGECLKIGGGDGSTGYGGGAVLVFAKNIIIKSPSTYPLFFKSGYSGAASGDGGEVVVMTKSMDVQQDSFVFGRTNLYADGSGDGNAGFANLLFCEDNSTGLSASIGDTTAGGQTHLSDFISLQGNQDYCQY